MAEFPRTAVLFGGPGREHDISVASGDAVCRGLAEHRPLRVHIHRDGRWQFGDDAPCAASTAMARLDARVDVVFNVVHGRWGEDGTLAALLETASVSYVGSGVAAAALSMDKIRSKWVYAALGLPTAAAEYYLASGRVLSSGAAIEGPSVAKEAREGSSYGIEFFESMEPARTHAKARAAAGVDVVIERRIQGREFTCAVLEHPTDGGVAARALPVTEIVPAEGHDFFDLAAKYTPGLADEQTPAAIDDGLRDAIQAAAVAAHEGIGCRDLSRTDFLVDEAGDFYLIETNSLPGMTGTSLFPQAAAAAGMDFPALLAHLIGLAAARRG